MSDIHNELYLINEYHSAAWLYSTESYSVNGLCSSTESRLNL